MYHPPYVHILQGFHPLAATLEFFGNNRLSSNESNKHGLDFCRVYNWKLMISSLDCQHLIDHSKNVDNIILDFLCTQTCTGAKIKDARLN